MHPQANTKRFAALSALLALAMTGTAAAATADYTIDPAHTYPSFEADHMGISVWRGKLDHTTGKVSLDKARSTGTVDVTMDVASIDFGLPALHDWAVGDKFFDAAEYPQATYKGRLTDFVGGAPTRVVGELTLHGVTRPVELTIAKFRCIPHPIFKRELCGADARGEFDRSAFGLDAGKDYGFDMTVALRIQVEALKDQ